MAALKCFVFDGDWHGCRLVFAESAAEARFLLKEHLPNDRPNDDYITSFLEATPEEVPIQLGVVAGIFGGE